MSVEAILDKISAHNADVVGCIAKHGDTIYKNLPDLYDMLDAGEVTEYAENMFALTDGLETDHAAFEQLFLEFENHSVFARRLEDGLLLLLNEPMERSQFKRMQVGVNLFLKPLDRALKEKVVPPQETPQSGAIRKTNRKRWF